MKKLLVILLLLISCNRPEIAEIVQEEEVEQVCTELDSTTIALIDAMSKRIKELEEREEKLEKGILNEDADYFYIFKGDDLQQELVPGFRKAEWAKAWSRDQNLTSPIKVFKEHAYLLSDIRTFLNSGDSALENYLAANGYNLSQIQITVLLMSGARSAHYQKHKVGGVPNSQHVQSVERGTKASDLQFGISGQEFDSKFNKLVIGFFKAAHISHPVWFLKLVNVNEMKGIGFYANHLHVDNRDEVVGDKKCGYNFWDETTSYIKEL